MNRFQQGSRFKLERKGRPDCAQRAPGMPCKIAVFGRFGFPVFLGSIQSEFALSPSRPT